MSLSSLLRKSQNKNSGFGGAWVAILIIALGAGIFAAIINNSDKTEQPLLNKVSSYYIATANDNIQDMAMLPNESWLPLNDSNLNLSTKPHWFKVPIPATSSIDKKTSLGRMVEISFANLDSVNAWFAVSRNDSDCGLEYCVMSEINTGDAFPFAERDVQHEQFILPVPDSEKPLTLFLQVETLGSIKVPIKLWNYDEYIQYTSSHRVFMGIFYGFMTAIALLNIFLYITSKNIVTLVYTGYVISLALAIATSQGLGFRYLWPNGEGWQQQALLFFTAANVYFSISFTANVLRIHEERKWLNTIYKSMKIVLVIYIACTLLLPYELLIETLGPIILGALLLIFCSTVYLSILGNYVAIYVSASYLAFFFSILLGIADSLNWISVNLDPSYLVMTSSAIQILFMALGLAMLFNQQNVKAEKAYTEATEQQKKSMEAKEALLKLQLENKEKLEYAIEERSYELEIAIRELNEANHELERKNSIDSLTGIPNRRLYDKRIEAEARRSRREKTSLAIAMLDIDYFKKVNDTYGHQCGDEALIHFSQVVKSCLKRPSDVFCRYGGEEFVLILPNTSLEGATTLLESIRKKTEDSPLQCEGKTINLTVSVGVTCRVIATDEEHSLLNAYADKLLYEAKESGRNKVVAKDY